MNDKKDFTTIKIYSPTAKRLKKFIKKNGLTIAGYASKLIDEDLKAQKNNLQSIKQ